MQSKVFMLASIKVHCLIKSSIKAPYYAGFIKKLFKLVGCVLIGIIYFDSVSLILLLLYLRDRNYYLHAWHIVE